MNAKDLMIGDWVRKGNLVGQVCDIEQRPKDGIIGVGLLDYGYDFYEDAELEPIPLTPEILEKNGFKWDGSGQRSMMLLSKPQFAEGLRFNIYVGLKRKTIEVFAAHPVEKAPNWRKSNKVYLEVCGCYVHELQHALRLCGIDKTIDL